jgi:hypothetical protein
MSVTLSNTFLVLQPPFLYLQIFINPPLQKYSYLNYLFKQIIYSPKQYEHHKNKHF